MIRFFFSVLELNPFLIHTLLEQFALAPEGQAKSELIRSLGCARNAI
jgi:hypothetical protein